MEPFIWTFQKFGEVIRKWNNNFVVYFSISPKDIEGLAFKRSSQGPNSVTGSEFTYVVNFLNTLENKHTEREEESHFFLYPYSFDLITI